MKTVQEALDWLAEQRDAEFATHYGEPGYTDPPKGIVFANWNNVDQEVLDLLDAEGYETEWSDEWVIDYNNDKAYRSSPDSYQWECQFIVGDGEYISPDDGAQAFIDELSQDHHNARWGCLPSWVTEADLHEAGYTLHKDELESGWHQGQTDDPESWAKQCFDDGAERVVFRKTENSQFYVVFECWVLWPEDDSDMENYERNE